MSTISKDSSKENAQRSLSVSKGKDTKVQEKEAKSVGPGPAYLDHTFRSPANTGPRKTPTIPDGGKWSVYAEIDIKAPPKYPYDAILDIHEWRVWNTFVPDVIITKHPNSHSKSLKMEQGTFMTFTVQISPTERIQTKTIAIHLEPLKSKQDGHKSHTHGHNITRIRWVSDNANLVIPGFVLKQERVNELEETDNGHTKYRTWLTFTGMQAKSQFKKYGAAYQQKIQDFVQDLKERSEKQYRAESGADQGGKADTNGVRMEPLTEIRSTTGVSTTA